LLLIPMADPTPPRVDRPLFFIDYDGTLAPIVDRPSEAYPHPAVPDLLVRLDARYPVVIVTGRYLQDVATLLARPLRAVGLHGLQEGVLGEAVEDLVPEAAAAALARLRAQVPEGDGVWIEEKGPTFAVHYRQATDEAAAQARLRRWAAEMPPVLEAIWGKKVVELRPKGFSKGVSVCRIARAHPARTPLYLGDDVTDEDAFEALGGDAVTIKVGPGETAARYRLPDVEAVVRYLQQYL
jgi:trehalose 6-phosphate phosphatase